MLQRSCPGAPYLVMGPFVAGSRAVEPSGLPLYALHHLYLATSPNLIRATFRTKTHSEMTVLIVNVGIF